MNITILLVDDEQDIRDVLSISLNDLGYRVVTAENGEEAIQKFHSISPAIVLSDIKMPGMDGIELLRKIKKLNPDTEVIMITGHGDMELAIKSLKYEATDFITKPIHDEALEIALKRAIERIVMRKQLREYTENLEKLVQEKTKQLIESERMAAIGETIAGLSHTIKNIASGLKGGAYVLEKGIELDEKEYLLQGWQMIKGNVEKIKNLSMDLLNYGKASELRLEMNDPNQPVREVVNLIKPNADAHGIDIIVDTSDRLKKFKFDAAAIHLCLINLITNAIDACKSDESPKPDEKKTIRIITKPAKGWGVEYQIIDNGCGMDDTVKEKIFESFFSTKGTHGTGIGLMMTKKIIDQHGGSIEVFSEKGKGTSFVIRLPMNI